LAKTRTLLFGLYHVAAVCETYLSDIRSALSKPLW